MKSLDTVREKLQQGELDTTLCAVYGCHPENTKPLAERYLRLLDLYQEYYGKGEPIALFSAPGRTEIGGNHTDHQLGRVLAASVDMDVIAVAVPNNSNVIRIKSEGHEEDVVSLEDMAVQESENNHSSAIIRGVAKGFIDRGYRVGGFNAYTTSSVLKGSGLSSSAAFEVLVGNMINTFYAQSEVDAITIAQIGQYAENVYYGKPSGLLDQMASSVGSVISVDFFDPKAPYLERVELDLETLGYRLCIIDSGADHGDLTDDYAQIPAEMKQVARFFGEEYLSRVKEEDFYDNLQALRATISDRALLRAMHFFADNQRVPLQIAALQQGDFQRFLALVKESGRSSYMYLQNIFVPARPEEQGVALTLALCEHLLHDKGGAWRVHGGGFAGTVQAFVPIKEVATFKQKIEDLVGTGRCHLLNIRPQGGVCVLS